MLDVTVGETWRPIPDWEDFYQASDFGRVRSLPRVVWREGKPLRRAGKVLTPGYTQDGYLTVVLCSSGYRETKRVHQLVMLAFHGPAPEGEEVRHLNGTRDNNALSNLAYGTRSENTYDSIAHGTHYSASRTHCKSGHPLVQGPHQRECYICKRAREKKARDERVVLIPGVEPGGRLTEGA